MITRRVNRRRYTPIPGLALHIAEFTNKRELKAELAAIRAAFADKVYAASEPLPRSMADWLSHPSITIGVRKEKTRCRI